MGNRVVDEAVFSPTDASSQKRLVDSAQRAVVALSVSSREQPYSIVWSALALSIRMLSSRGALGHTCSSRV